jgi:hypothetical protein
MSRNTSKFGDFDVITGPPAPLRRVPAVAPLRPAEAAAPESAKSTGPAPAAPDAAPSQGPG